MKKATSKKNAFYAQSGGVSAVINASACGVIETSMRQSRYIGKVYAGRDGIVGALQYASQHNATAAKWAARMERGEISWALMFGFMVMPFVVQSATMWQDTEKNPALAKAEMPSLDELAAKNEQDLEQFMAAMAKQFGQAPSMAEFTAEVVPVVGEADAKAD